MVFSAVFLIIVVGNLRNIYSEKIYEDENDPKLEDTQFAVVFGASVDKNGEPTKMLEDRVESAVTLYEAGVIQRIVISGNDEAEFSEVKAMRNILKKNNIPDFLIIEDKEATSTFETCLNVKKELKINKAILITQEFHLPRALYLCNSLGVESVGFAADRGAYTDQRLIQIRENFAIIKGFLDVNILR
jgi:vancomycin permeability regulator SanA